MTDSDPNDPATYGLKMSKRDFIKLVGATGAVVGSVTGLDSDGESGNLWGGTMALTQAFKVASGDRDWYQGPDSAKDAISGQNGDRYSATDTQIEYYWDDGWTALGVGSSSKKAPASHFESLSTDELSTRAKDADWNIYKTSGGTVIANGDGGGTFSRFSGNDLDGVLSSVLGALPSGRTREVIVSVKGDFEVDAETIINESNLYLDLYGASITPTENINASERTFFVGKDIGGGTPDISNITIAGGVFDGAATNADAIRIYGNHVDGTHPVRLIDTEFKNFREGVEVATRRTQIHGVTVQDGSSWGFKCNGSDANWYNCISLNNGNEGWDGVGNWAHLYHCIAQENSGVGFRLRSGRGNNAVFHGGYSEFNGGVGVVINLDQTSSAYSHNFVRIRDMAVLSNTGPGIQIQDGEKIMIEDVMFHDLQGTPSQTNSVEIQAGVEDVHLRNVMQDDNPSGVSDNGTRTRWNGVIAGGPLGGTDIGALTGADAGDEAEADGTDASATDGEMFRFDGTDWQSVADPSTTITPA